MSMHEDRVSLGDMLRHGREAVALLGGAPPEDLGRDRVLELALTRLVEVIGEAANRVSPETRARYVEIPWAQIISMRNRLVHGYDVIDYDLLWDTVTHDLPPLIASLEQILGEA